MTKTRDAVRIELSLCIQIPTDFTRRWKFMAGKVAHVARPRPFAELEEQRRFRHEVEARKLQARTSVHHGLIH